MLKNAISTHNYPYIQCGGILYLLDTQCVIFFVYPILGKTLAQYWGTFSSLLLNFALVFVWIESASLFRRLHGQIWLSLAPQPESPDDQK